MNHFLSLCNSLIQNFPKGEIKEVVEINVDDEGNLNSFSYVIKSSVSKKNKKKLNTDDEDIDEAFKVQINKTSQSLSAHFQPPSTQKPKNTQGNQQQQQQQGNQQNQKEQQQPEQEAGIMGFLKNNFWYILIGLLVFNFMSNQNPEAAAGGQGGQGQARAPAPRQ